MERYARREYLKYVGSKNKISKYIAPIIQKAIDDNGIEIYYEPFVGGANMIDKIKCKYRIGNDIHKELIAMFKALQDGWKPPMHISEEEYIKVRDNRDKYADYYVGFVGFCATWGSKWFGGYARGYKADGITPRDMSNEAIRNLMTQLPKIKDVVFLSHNYLDLMPYGKSVIYCDPPYMSADRYYSTSFDSDVFWNWCRKIAKTNILFVSEYQAPSDFQCIWSKNHVSTLSTHNNTKRIEKLFVPSGTIYSI